MPSEWYLMNTSETYFSGNENEEFSTYATDAFNQLLNNSPEVYDIEIVKNQLLKKAIIHGVTTDVLSNMDTRNILIEIGTINIGDYIKLKDKIWIVYSDVDNNRIYEKGMIRKCNHNLKWVDNKGNIQKYPAFVRNETRYTSGERVDLFIREGNTLESILLPSDENTREITNGKRFIINNHVWRVTKVDWDVEGLVSLVCEENKFNPATDNEELGIADYYNDIHTYKLNILNKNPILSTINTPITLEIQAFDNDVIDENPELEFIISNNSIISIEDNKIIPLSKGNCELTVKYHNVQSNVSVNVIEQEVKQYTVEISGNAYIKWGRQATYTAIFKESGQVYTNTCSFYLTDKDGNNTNLATIVSQDTNTASCVVKANSNELDGYVVLHALDNTGLHGSKEIEIRSFWL